MHRLQLPFAIHMQRVLDMHIILIIRCQADACWAVLRAEQLINVGCLTHMEKGPK